MNSPCVLNASIRLAPNDFSNIAASHIVLYDDVKCFTPESMRSSTSMTSFPDTSPTKLSEFLFADYLTTMAKSIQYLLDCLPIGMFGFAACNYS